MVEVEIRGKKFPLCLTVAALDQVNERCGSLAEVSKWLSGNGNAFEGLCNVAWMLGLLIQEGEENRLVESRFTGEQTDRRAVPDSDAIRHLMTPGEIKSFMVPVMEAVHESVAQTIEAEETPSKNGESAGR